MPDRPHRPARPTADVRASAHGAVEGARRAVRAALSAVGGLVYPDLCLGCDRRVPAREEEDALAGLPLCPTCLAGLPLAASTDASALLADARAAGTVAGAIVLWTYDAGGTVRRVQHALKYGGRAGLGRPLGALVGAAWQRSGGDDPIPGEPGPGSPGGPDLVVPVPLASVRLLERGYNQAAALAEGVAGALGVEVRTDRLVRQRATRSQTSLSPAERRANVNGAFRVPAPAAVAGRHVLLIDDVLTTGATLVAAARPLAEAGARVSVAVLAIAGT